METYDIFMLLVLGAATLFGFWKGLAWQIASVSSMVVSYLAALRFSPQLAPRIGTAEPWNKFVAMLIIFVATSFVIWTLFRLVSGIIDRVKLKEFDHQLGAVLGFGKGILWCMAITFFAVTLLPQTQQEKIVASRAGRYIVILLDKAEAVVPPEFHHVTEYIQRFEQRLDPNATGQQPLLNIEPHQIRDLYETWQGQTPPTGAQPTQGYWPPSPTGTPEPRPFQPPYSAGQAAPTTNY